MATASTALLGADLTYGLTTQLQTPLVGDDTTQALDPWAIPAPTFEGFELPQTISTDIRVVFHENPQARTVWFLLDPDAAPLVGDYTIEIDTHVVTYDATSGAPADVDALLTAIADEINDDVDAGAVVTATRAKLRDTSASGAYDAIKLVAAPSAASPSTGIPVGAVYSTFALGSDCSFPALAQLHIVREVDKASAKFWSRPAHQTASTVVSNANAIVSGHLSAWVVEGNGDLGALDEGGYDERATLPARSAFALQLYTPIHTDESLSIASSGAGIYRVTNWATAYVAPAIETEV